MIPKIIHVIWFGDTEINWKYKDKVEEMYSDYKIKIWTNDDFDFNTNHFTKYAFENKKWAFLSDYFRMVVLANEGGIYLDIDMDPVNKIDDNDLDKYNLVVGHEYKNNLTMGFIATIKNNEFVIDVINYYDSLFKCNWLPLGNIVWTEIFYDRYHNIKTSNKTDSNEIVKIYNSNAFASWRSKKGSDVYFIHRHNILWMKYKFQIVGTKFLAKFAKLTPGFVQNIMTNFTRKKYKLSKPKNVQMKTITVDNVDQVITRELFSMIKEYSDNGAWTKIILKNKNKEMINFLKKLNYIKTVNVNNSINDYDLQLKINNKDQVKQYKNMTITFGENIKIINNKKRSELEENFNYLNKQFKNNERLNSIGIWKD